MKADRILLSHGSGGRLSHQLIKDLLVPTFDNPLLNRLDDGAIFQTNATRLVMTTDSYVVDPIFFPGGDIGKLAVSGTVNDLAVMGATPRYLSLGLLIEEGFLLEDLRRILDSIRKTCQQAGVEIVTGDTKVVPRGSLDKIFINTSGVGEIPEGLELSGRIQPGDRIIINGTIGDHGTTILAQREGLNMDTPLQSDCAPLNDLIASLRPFAGEIRLMRDPTRGGVATTLNEFVEGAPVGIDLYEEKLPFRQEVRALCEILGIDPLFLANEGKVILVVSARISEQVLATLREQPLGQEATVIGEVTADHPGRVVLETNLGTRRILDMLTGEQLPRIC